MKLNIKTNQLFLFLLTISLATNAQNNTDFQETDSQKRITEFSEKKRHGVSLDVIAGLGFSNFNPRYEYVLDKYSGIGADLNINLDRNNGTEVIEKFSFSPFYRQYFFSKEDYGAKGFYGEGFLKFYTYSNDFSTVFGDIVTSDNKSFFETAIGVGIGWKWISNSGFLIDISAGLGRNLGFANDPEERDLAGKFGINLGWQF
jgi:hypothetical protein